MPKNKSNVMYYGISAAAIAFAYYIYTKRKKKEVNKKEIKKKIPTYNYKDDLYNILIESINKSKEILKYDTKINYKDIKDRYNNIYESYDGNKINVISKVLGLLYSNAVWDLDTKRAEIFKLSIDILMNILIDRKFILPYSGIPELIKITDELISSIKKFTKEDIDREKMRRMQ